MIGSWRRTSRCFGFFLEFEISFETYLGFNPTTDVEDRVDFERIMARRAAKQAGVPTALVAHLRKTEVFRIFLRPIVFRMDPNVGYTSEQMADMLGDGWSAKRVASKLCVMGRPEKTFNAKIF